MKNWLIYFTEEEKKYINNPESLFYIKILIVELHNTVGNYKKAMTVAYNYYLKNFDSLKKEQLCSLLGYADTNAREIKSTLDQIKINREKLKVCVIKKFKIYDIYSRIGLNELALKSYKEFNTDTIKKQYSFNYASTLNNIGVFHMRAKKWDSAYYYYSKSLRYFKQINVETLKKNKKLAARDFWIGLVKGNIAQCHMNFGEYDKALPLLLYEVKSANFFLKKKNWSAKNSSWEQLASCYLNLNKFKIANKYIDSLKGLDNYLYLKLKSSYHKDFIKSDSSTYFSEKYNKINDSLNIINEKEKKQAIINLIDFQEEIVAQKEEINKINNENIIRNNRIKIISGLFIIALIILFALGIFYYKLRKQKTIISSQKNSIEKNLTEKNILLNELNHRVKNNLQVMSSIMNLQLNKIKNASLKETFQYSINKINVLSIVHSTLFKNESLSDISLLEYIKSIIDNLNSLYNTQKQISYNINIPENLSIHIDQTQAIGLIINELITNSYKYAFREEKDNLITISISKKADVISFDYRDNGIGIDVEEINKNKTIGINLIRRLVNQLGSKPLIESVNGMKITFNFIEKSTI
ncbi:histidine kinase dimerization/phosphoacceptor domain -containing protein [Lutibacter sp. Hel_I_33_5]|uniref:histidine kinase dimerization/phosphoacceptor domain -containing protein n=1 Tax=Lutibacter sp. Hel_I_33_5 TaxID=1566289 RepID=UPI0016472A5F|nr:histidine kinase dimerization/phosphoacceptor domain -containing protein [Lutibacter sp. Hel_I_33_5]